ncbi:MAG TPA: DUF6789 family protein [Candidatus Limnocylindria bacterium]|nr:DUF6789 family protein [Candidatus Limnocylindria bacterium]
MDRIGRGIAAGFLGGLGATLIMSAVMLAARRAGVTPRLPPDKIAEAGIEQVKDGPSDEDEETAVATVSHFAFGAGAGALYGGLTARAAPLPLPVALAAGLAFGSAVWLVSYQGWVPALGIMPPASRDHPGRVATMVVAHWVFGAALGASTRQLRHGVLD